MNSNSNFNINKNSPEHNSIKLLKNQVSHEAVAFTKDLEIQKDSSSRLEDFPTLHDHSCQTVQDSSNNCLSAITEQNEAISQRSKSSLERELEKLLEINATHAHIMINQIQQSISDLVLNSYHASKLSEENWAITFNKNNNDNRLPHLENLIKRLFSLVVESNALQGNKESKNREDTKTWRRALQGLELVEIFGSGAHGVVIKARNPHGHVFALKIYNNDQKEVFLNEVVLSPHSGINQVFTVEKHGFNVIIMRAGIGTLADFKHFLKEKQLRLTNDELFTLFDELLKQYTGILARGICHRDIKPANIILTDNLEVKIIDFSLALYLNPQEKTFTGSAGTHGYIAPHIFSNQHHSREDLILGDFFSIGVTILEMAFPNYIPKQDDTNGIKNTISKLEPSSKLLELLNLSLFPSVETAELHLQTLKTYLPSFHRKLFEKRCSSLKNYSQLFKEYLLSNKDHVVPNKSSLSPEIQGLFGPIDHSSDPKAQDIEHFDISIWSSNVDYETKIENYKKAASYYKQSNKESKVLLCYENVAKISCFQGDNKTFAEFCNMIVQELREDSSIPCHPCLFSTLGIHFYLKNNIKQARIYFQRGLEKCKSSQDNDSKMLLLVNYIFILLDLKSEQIEPQDQYKNEYNQTLDQIQELFSALKKQTTVRILGYSLDDNVIDKTKSFMGMCDFGIGPRESDIILSIFTKTYHRGPNPGLNIKLPFQIAFYHVCLDRANKWKSKLTTEEQKKILPRLKEFVSSAPHISKYYSLVYISKCCRGPWLLIILLSFFKMLQEMKDEYFTRQELAEIRDEIERFDKHKKELYALFKKGRLKQNYKELSQFELFYVMSETFLSHNSEDSEKLQKKKQCKESDDLCWQLLVLLDLSPLIKFKTDCFRKYHLDYLKDISAKFGPASHILVSNFHQYEVSVVYKVAQKDLNSNKEIWWPIIELSLDFYINIYGMSNFSGNINSITSLKSLKSLKMNFYVRPIEVYFTGWQGLTFKDEDIRKFINSLPQLTSIKTIFFALEGMISMTDKQMKDLIKALSALKGLKKLKFKYSSSNVTSAQIDLLNEGLKEMTQLKAVSLKFYHCLNITRESILAIASTISELLSLRKVTLSCILCRILDEEKSKIKSLFEKLPLTTPAKITITL